MLLLEPYFDFPDSCALGSPEALEHIYDGHDAYVTALTSFDHAFNWIVDSSAGHADPDFSIAWEISGWHLLSQAADIFPALQLVHPW